MMLQYESEYSKSFAKCVSILLEIQSGKYALPVLIELGSIFSKIFSIIPEVRYNTSSAFHFGVRLQQTVFLLMDEENGRLSLKNLSFNLF